MRFLEVPEILADPIRKANIWVSSADREIMWWKGDENQIVQWPSEKSNRGSLSEIVLEIFSMETRKWFSRFRFRIIFGFYSLVVFYIRRIILKFFQLEIIFALFFSHWNCFWIFKLELLLPYWLEIIIGFSQREKMQK